MLNDKIQIKKYMIIVLICAVISIIIGVFFDLDILREIKIYIETKNSLGEITCPLEQFQKIDDNDLLNHNKMLYTDLNRDVVHITIRFKEALKETTNIKLYYADKDDNEINPENIRTVQVEPNQIESRLKIKSYVKEFLIDINSDNGSNPEIESIIIDKNITFLSTIKTIFKQYISMSSLTLERILLIFIMLLFIGIHFCIKPKIFYSILFDKRWIVAAILLLFFVINRYNGDSLGVYDFHIQPGIGSEYLQPIIGAPRPIRSDEWVVTSPNALSSQFGNTPFGKYTNILRGTKTLNAPVGGIHLGITTLANTPFNLIWLILKPEYAYSFVWYIKIILTFMVTLELFYIISKKEKLLSVAGAFLVVCSSYYLWWSFPPLLLYAPACIVCAYYFFESDKMWKKILFGFGTAIAATNFVTSLYPAWQVPIGYMFLAILIWLIHDKWQKIKQLKKKEWAVIIGSFVVFVFILGSYLLEISEYTDSITNTLYPGNRRINGEFALNKIFYYLQAPLYAYKDIGNPSEAGVFLTLFPIPTIAIVYAWLKEKKKDWLTGCLLISTIPLLIYVTIGLPSFIANITLYSFSAPKRAIDILGYIQIYFIVIIFSHYKDSFKIPKKLAIFISFIVVGSSYIISRIYYADYCSTIYSILAIIVFAFIGYCMMAKISDNIRKKIYISLILISLFTSILIRPLSKGLDSIYSKPAAKEIMNIVKDNPDKKWLAVNGGVILPAFAVACGAPTINSINSYPNLDLWYKLDPSKQYEEAYNRYAHIPAKLTRENTSMKLEQQDMFVLNLSYKDIKKADVTYILSLGKMEDSEGLDLLYSEVNIFIYKVK